MHFWKQYSLGNTRTHFRNIFGNAAFMPVRGIKNIVGAGIETVVLPKAERTKSVTKTDESKNFAKQDWELMADVVKGNDGKYNIKRGMIGVPFPPKIKEVLEQIKKDDEDEYTEDTKSDN